MNRRSAFAAPLEAGAGTAWQEKPTMSEAAPMAAQPRSKTGKGTARALRREDRLPAVIYGDKKDPVSISVAFRDVQKMIEQGNVNNQIYAIEVSGTIG